MFNLYLRNRKLTIFFIAAQPTSEVQAKEENKTEQITEVNTQPADDAKATAEVVVAHNEESSAEKAQENSTPVSEIMFL